MNLKLLNIYNFFIIIIISRNDLNVIQRFLDRCHKRHFTSQTVSIFNLLEQQDKSAFKRAIDNHMLGAIIPKDKELVYNLRRRRCHIYCHIWAI